MKIPLASLFFLSLSLCGTLQQNGLPLRVERDVPLSGGSSRFDYQSMDEAWGRLYIAHLGADSMIVFDTKSGSVIGEVKDLKRVHGVLAVPELHRVFASATGTNELVAIDDGTLQIQARIPAGDYPDGIAYASKERKLYVSDLHGKTDTVIDPITNRVVATIKLGGGAGNTQYDAGADRIYVTVHGADQLAEIDPKTDTVIARYGLPGCSGSHGLLLDQERRLAFVACEDNAKLAVVDLTAGKLTAIHRVGSEPDVLAFDRGPKRLYVSAESGIVTIFDEQDRGLAEVGQGFFGKNAHSVSVDQTSHRVYFPLDDVGGKPVLRIAMSSDKQTSK
jgi:YVTN family beta-propeller protein